MDSNLLKVFVAVSEQKSISLGALELGFTQSNVTLRIKQLEKTLGYELFHRVPKGVILTQEGEKLYPLAKEIVQKIENASIQMQNMKEQTLLRIGTSQANATIRLLRFIETVQRDFPLMSLEVYTSGTPSVLEKLLAYQIDIAFITGDPKHLDIEVLNQFSDDLYLVEPQDKRCPNTLIGYREKSTHFDFLKAYEEGLGNKTYQTMIVENYEVMLGCVKAGMGKAFLSKKIIEKFGYVDTLTLTKLAQNECDLQTRLVCRKDNVPFIADYLQGLC
ncbi:LysR family transcriptional regulator [Sulfurospirillum sp. MES]|uniref:LysR family transcriptional regulator n=1 Tax=Sulfurospirillum sp. MES TaxID=1565314 RepID=UPI00054317C3|nr:LysR family transcriptional regulator [Sulfurospirillum sp. MES]KHG32891.1 MAG: LysR family transcriptional regulator [Sulfurospirillum sp. MES]